MLANCGLGPSSWQSLEDTARPTCLISQTRWRRSSGFDASEILPASSANRRISGRRSCSPSCEESSLICSVLPLYIRPCSSRRPIWYSEVWIRRSHAQTQLTSRRYSSISWMFGNRSRSSPPLEAEAGHPGAIQMLKRSAPALQDRPPRPQGRVTLNSQPRCCRPSARDDGLVAGASGRT